MDEDIDKLDREALIAEVQRLRTGIRKHRDSSGHELCWHHPELWRLLPEGAAAVPVVPGWPQFFTRLRPVSRIAGPPASRCTKNRRRILARLGRNQHVAQDLRSSVNAARGLQGR